jgi:hypothetical protein
MDVPNIVEFVTDPQCLGLSISPAQETLLRAIYGLPLNSEQLEIWRLCTARATYPEKSFGEATVIVGARGGKDSRIAGPIVVYEALFGGHEMHLAKGERGVISLVAQDQRGTRTAFVYVRDYLAGSPLLSAMIDEVLTFEVKLTNGLSILCFPSTLRSVRGFSIPVAVLDEMAFFRLEGQADSDAEIQASIRRGMIGFPLPRLVKISTPYMKDGVVYEDFQRAFAQDNQDLLVWRSSSALMNPSLKPERLAREQRLDPTRFAREYEAEFTEDLEAFLPGALVDNAVKVGRHELPPVEGLAYRASVDAMGAGLQNADRFALSIVHPEGVGGELRVVQDVVRGWGGRRGQQVDLQAIVHEIAGILRRYDLSETTGDDYAAGWVKQAFEREKIRYRTATIVRDGKIVKLDKSRAYVEAGPLFDEGRIDLLDHPEMIRELKLLERRPRQGGRIEVDHPRGGHDDHANALALAAAPFAAEMPIRFWGGNPYRTTEEEQAAEERERKEQSAEMIRTAVAKSGVFWPGEGTPRPLGGWGER